MMTFFLRLIDKILYPEYANRDTSKDIDPGIYEIYDNGAIEVFDSHITEQRSKALEEIEKSDALHRRM